MNLTALLQFVPLAIGAFLAYHFIIREKLPSQSLGKILSYFIGVLIVLLAVGWFIRSYMPGWAARLLNTGTSSPEWQQLINTSEGIVNDAIEQSSGPVSQPTVVQVQPPVVFPTTVPSVVTPSAPGQIIQYTVVPGDTLTSIAQRYNTTVQEIMRLNNLTSPDYIKAGDVLYIDPR